MPIRKAEAAWEGDLLRGNGRMNVAGQSLEYSFGTRMENAAGTNPEEMIGAAHAGCFSMALSAILGKSGFQPQRIATTAEVSFDKVGEGFKITKITLRTRGRVPNIDHAKFREIAEMAKTGCPVSQALSATPIELDAVLES
jgi:lipoyl-dependent peroxiredoxin